MAIPRSIELSKLLDDLLGRDARYFLAGAGQPFAPTIRLNPLKHTLSFQRELLTQQGFRIEEIPWIPHGFRVCHQPAPVGKSLSHFLGHLYIQNLASMLPPLILDPRPGEKVLDMCAAPGSKATSLAALMKNSGILLVNDCSGKRLRSLIFNLRRTGITNTVALRGPGEQLGNTYFEYFDRVLLDPPCSALGTLQKSPEVLDWWTPKRTEKLSVQQRGLLRSGLKALKPGGVLVYSTCTITPEENEQIIQHALETFPVCLERISLPIPGRRPGLSRFRGGRFDPTLDRALRLYPFETRTEGFFIARLRKTGTFGTAKNLQLPHAKCPFVPSTDAFLARALCQLSARFDFPLKLFESYRFVTGAALCCSNLELGDIALFSKPASVGLPIANTRSGAARITTEGCHLFGSRAGRMTLDLDETHFIERYLNRCRLHFGPTTGEDTSGPNQEGSSVLDAIPASSLKSPVHSEGPLPDAPQLLIRHRGHVLGHASLDDREILSRFPRSGWPFSLTAVTGNKRGNEREI